MKSIVRYLLVAVAGILAGGCASPDVNPATARPHTGYVDFYAVNADNLCWDIRDAQGNKKLFYEFHPVSESILRLAFKPGHHKLRVTFLNHAIIRPGIADVDVFDGKVTPVTVTLLPAGTVLVENRDAWAGGTYYGRYGRRTRITSNEAASYEVSAEPREPLPYEPKSQMPYFQAPEP